MRLFVASLFLLITVVSASASIRYEQLRYSGHDGLMYEKGRDQPYTGTVKTYEGRYLVEKSEYKNGRMHGKSKHWDVVDRRIFFFFDTGLNKRVLRSKGNYVDGKREGEHIGWYASGKLSSKTFYKDDRATGVSKMWNSKGGLMSTCLYENGRKNGEEWFWNAEGIPQSKSVWSNDVHVEATYFNRTGGVTRIVGFSDEGSVIDFIKEWDFYGNEIFHHKETFPDGVTKKTYALTHESKLQGELREYYPNGDLKVVANYMNGDLHNWYREWYKGDKKKVVAIYWYGKRDRLYSEYNEDGTLSLYRTYDMGRVVSEETIENIEPQE